MILELWKYTCIKNKVTPALTGPRRLVLFAAAFHPVVATIPRVLPFARFVHPFYPNGTTNFKAENIAKRITRDICVKVPKRKKQLTFLLISSTYVNLSQVPDNCRPCLSSIFIHIPWQDLATWPKNPNLKLSNHKHARTTQSMRGCENVDNMFCIWFGVIIYHNLKQAYLLLIVSSNQSTKKA